MPSEEYPKLVEREKEYLHKQRMLAEGRILATAIEDFLFGYTERVDLRKAVLEFRRAEKDGSRN